jgi:hypothetical protein
LKNALALFYSHIKYSRKQVTNQTKAQVEERGGALLLPHQLIKKANNCGLVETQAGKRYPGVLLPHEFFQATL